MAGLGVAYYNPKNLRTLERQNAYWREICAKAEQPHIHKSSLLPDTGVFSDVRSPLGSFYRPAVDRLSSFFDGAAGKSSYLYGTDGMSDFHRYVLTKSPNGRPARSESVPASARSDILRTTRNCM
jgi:hypothetical protein